VATFGGQKLPTVTIYMDGFYDGAKGMVQWRSLFTNT
jgi:hypothetical protein